MLCHITYNCVLIYNNYCSNAAGAIGVSISNKHLNSYMLIFKCVNKLNVEKSGNSEDKARCQIVSEELERFKRLIAGHRKLLTAIGNL